MPNSKMDVLAVVCRGFRRSQKEVAALRLPGYSSRMESGYFGDFKDSFTKEKTNTSAEKNKQACCLDCLFYLFRRKRRSPMESEDNINKFPDEIILMIFKWLPMKCLIRSMLVCKRWCQIARDESLWTTIDLNDKVLNKGVLGHILQRGVQTLKLQLTKIVDPVFCEVLSDSYVSKLQSLHLTGTVISPVGLATLLSKCKYLKILWLGHCKINRDYCRAISQIVALKELTLDMCSLEDGCFTDLMKLKCLTTFHMCNDMGGWRIYDSALKIDT